jgi:hypothetical protein
LFPGNVSASTNPAAETHQRAYVVYDTSTGEILHVHYAIEAPEGVPVREDAVHRARRIAGNARPSDVLEVEPAELHHPNRPNGRSIRFKVDVEAKRIVLIDNSR